MNYRHIYMRIISHAKQKMNLGLRPKNQLDKKNFPNQYFEFHHILPKSIFPVWKDRETNLETVKAKNLSMGKELLKEKYSNFKKMTLEKQLAYRQKQRENSTGKLWYNNGEKNVKSRFCPKGFIKGRLPMISKNRGSQKGENNNNAKVITEVCTNFQWKLQKEAIKDLGCGSYVFRLFRDSQNYTINVLNLLNYYKSKDLTIPKKLIDWCKNHPKIMQKGLLGDSATFKRA